MHRFVRIAMSALALALASAPAGAGPPKGVQLLDHDLVLLPSLERESFHQLVYARTETGRALLMDGTSNTMMMRVTPLGFTPPIGSNKGSYTATPEGPVWAAFASAQEIRVFELGDLRKPGPLAPVLRDVVAIDADPGSVQMGIIAILIGLVVEERPALFIDCFQGGCAKNYDALVLGWDGRSFAPVSLMESDGIWFFF